MSSRSVLANFKATSVSRIGTAALGFVLFWWLARQLTSADVGGYALATGIYFTVQLLPMLGLNIAMVRTAATNPGNLKQIINEHWWFSLPIGVLMGIGLACYALFLTEGPIQNALLITALVMVPTTWIGVAETALVGIEQMHRTAGASLLESVWRVVGSAVAILLGGGLPAVMLVFFIGRTAIAIYYLTLPELPRPSITHKPTNAALLALWKTTPIYLGITVLAALNYRFDILSLGQLVSLSEVGKYSAGAKIFEALIMFPTLGAYVILPSLARIHVSDPDRFARSLFKILRGVLVIGLPISLVFAAASPWIIGLLFAPDFVDAVPVLQILCFAAVLATLDLVLSSTMIASNAQAADLRTILGALVVLVVAMFTLVPIFGITGAALAVFLNMLFRTVYRLFWASNKLKNNETWLVLLKSSGSIAVAWCAVVFTPRLPWPITAFEGVIVYLLCSMATGLVTVSELRLTLGAATRALQKAR